MRRISISLATLTPLLLASAAWSAPIWLDDDWNIVKSEAQASYYLAQPMTEENGVWPVTVYFQGGDIVNFKGSFNSEDISAGKSVGEYEIYYDNGHLLSTGSRNNLGQYEGLTRFYNDEGILSHEATFVAGKERGLGKYFYPNGQIEEEFTIIDGNRVGEDVHYYENSGSVWQRHRFTDGKAHGIQSTYYPNGSLRQESNSAMGTRQGEYKNYYENGQVSYQVTYLNDQPEGLGVSYNEDGSVYLEITYVKGKKHGVERGWYGEEQLRFEKPNVDGKLHGIVTNYYQSGNTKSIENFVKGRRRGSQRDFYDQIDAIQRNIMISAQGDKTSETRFDKNGVMTHEYLASFPNKKRISDEKNYKNAVLIERTQKNSAKKWQLEEKFDKKGKLTHRIEKVNGKRHNAYISIDIYTDNIETTYYKNGVRSGKRYVVTPLGKTIESGAYFKGKQTGVWLYRYNGLTRNESYNRKGQLHGELSVVDADGKRITWEHYRNGNRHGFTESYTDSGTLLAKGKYVSGKRDGQWLHQEEYESDVVIWSGEYQRGKKIGKWFAHSGAGYELGREQYDQQGRKQGIFYFFAEHGALKRIERYLDDEKNGNTDYYETDGKTYHSEDVATSLW